jgi:hypothetical protein
MLLPAFLTRGYYVDTASSSVGAAMIARLPMLASSRLTKAYTYVDYPAIIQRNISTSDVAAIKSMRESNTFVPASDADWDTLHETITIDNMKSWSRILK